MTKFCRAHLPPEEIERLRCDLKSAPAAIGALDDETIDGIIQRELSAEIWINDVYQVEVRRDVKTDINWPPMVHLSIKRLDREPIHDFRELQAIKNELVGPENEGVELYPAESRLVDSANQFHLWVLASPDERFPFGFSSRLVTDEAFGKSIQRKFKEGDT